MQKTQQPVLQSIVAIFKEFEKRVKLVEPEKTFHKGKGDYLYYKREENPELKKLCFLPANKRPSEYDYIKTNTFYGAKESIHQLILAEEFSLTSYSVFTEVNGMVDEFFCIHTHIDSVVDIQMFTFIPERENTILVRDFKILIEILTEKYSQVSWGARKENTLNSIFREMVEYYKGIYKTYKYKKSLEEYFCYKIQGKSKKKLRNVTYKNNLLLFQPPPPEHLLIV